MQGSEMRRVNIVVLILRKSIWKPMQFQTKCHEGYHFTPNRMENAAITSGSSLAASQKVKHRITIRPNNSTTMYIPKKNERHMSTQKPVHEGPEQYYS